MKKTITPIVFLIILSVLSFIILTKADNKIMTNEEALKLGEEKYLKFLWMVDGVFNSDKMNNDFIINGNSLSKEDKIFTCKYKNNNECVGDNFETEFANIFSKYITYEDVYSDGEINSIISYNNGKYLFNIIDSCSINRMDLNQKIDVTEITDNRMVYKVYYNNGEHNITNKRNFVLVLEDDEWKISNAFYHDICGMQYYIG
jgi:hypothetical protein